MVGSIGNEVRVNAKPEDSHGMNESNVANDLAMMESEVCTSEGGMLLDDVKGMPVKCSKVDQNMNAEPADKGPSLSEKSVAYDIEYDGKSKMDELTEVGSNESSVCNKTNDFVHDQEVMGKNIEAAECKNVSPVSTRDAGSVPAEEGNTDVEIGKNDALKGNVIHVDHESVSVRSKDTVEQNGETHQILDSEVDITFKDVKSSDFPLRNEESFMMPHNICNAVANAANTDATVISSVEELQSNPGNVQLNTNGFASSGKLCEQGNGTNPSNVVDLVTTASGQPVEASELIESSKHHNVEEQGYFNDTEKVDSGEAKQVVKDPVEFTPAISFSQSEDDDDQIESGSYLQGKASDSEDERVVHAGKSLCQERKNVKRADSRLGSLAKEFQRSCATYDLPPETADELSVDDLVWGKVKSHPWWPGQVFDPSDSSEKALKYRKKDCYLVAYFGDKSFAWNDASQLKPFRAHFSREEKQNSSDSFQNAIDCALEEVSRRAELGLACSCTPKETYDNIRFQIVENAGIQTGSCKREGGDGYISAESFQPDKLVNYVRNLARLSTYGANQLELTIAKAQLLSFYRLKDGRQMLPELQYFEGLLENDFDTSFPQVNSLPSENENPDSVAPADVSCTVKSKGPKRKHNLKDIVYQRRKEKSFSEIMGESLYHYDDEGYDSDEKVDGKLNSPTVGRKRKASNFLDDEPTVPETIRTISLAKVSKTATPSPRQSFKIGDCIRRVASQLTGSLSTVKSTDDGNNQQVVHNKPSDASEDTQNEDMVISREEISPDDFLVELYLTAQAPSRAHGFSKSLISYFSEFRDATVSAMRKSKQKTSSARGGSGRKRKSSLSLGVAPEEFECHDRKDSYWADMVVENNSEEKKPARRGRKRKERLLGEAEESEKPKKTIQRKKPRKQKVNGNHELSVDQSSAEKEKHELPTELLLNFRDSSAVPSEADLNRMFRRFGPLKTSETQADKLNSRARVVFKNGSDAEIALSSAATFNIFGSATVSYQLIQTPSISSHTSSTIPSVQCAMQPPSVT